MPHFPRQFCASQRELALWDECAAAQAQVDDLQRNLADLFAVVDQLRGAHHASPPQPPPPPRKVVMQQVAARARCFRRGLSNEARRHAVDYAMSIGALGPDFDEDELPWKDGVYEGPRVPPRNGRATRPKRARSLPAAPRALPPPPPRGLLHTDLIIHCLERIPARDSRRFELFVVARLARLAGTWSAMEREIRAVWEVAEDIEGLDPGRVCYPGGQVAYEMLGLRYPNRQLARQSDGVARYPDGALACASRWFYPGGETAWNGLQFFLPNPGHDLVVDMRSSEVGDRIKWILRRAARVFGADLLRGCKQKLAKLPEGVRGLALAELCAVGCKD